VHPEAPLPAAPSSLAEALIGWFEGTARELPWRRDRTPYRVWLSEVMLQQTRVATVVDYFERFTARFPSVEALAAASEDEVLALWSGLGYYARGRNLHRAAQLVANERGGVFPDDAEGLLQLPGVGRYTAAAIASLAFGHAEPLVDGNVSRVLMRLCDDDTPFDTPKGQRVTWARAADLVEAAAAPGPLNEGLMELGALVCAPRAPNCEACPWSAACRGRAAGRAAELPVRAGKTRRKTMRLACAVLHDDDWVWLERRPSAGLFGGLYQPPASELQPRQSATSAVGALLGERGIPVPARLPRAVRVERTLTHRDLRLDVIAVQTARGRRRGAPWFHGDRLSEVGLSSAVRAVLGAAWPASGRFLGPGGPRS
jgi:A/G-specific adenine glycosylase